MFSHEYLRHVRTELSRLRESRRHLDRAIQMLEEQLGTAEQFDLSLDHATRSSSPSEIKDQIAIILQDSGGAMHYSEVYDELLQRGFVIRGKAPARNVGAYLSSDMRFESVGGGKWTVRTQTRTKSGAATENDTLASQQASTPDSWRSDPFGELALSDRAHAIQEVE